MSGSEIVEEIERRTEGHWRPSPGSIYPLLAWLRKRSYIVEVQGGEAGTRRYELTKQGKSSLSARSMRGRACSERFRFFEPPMWFQFYPERAQELREATGRLALAVWNFRAKLQRRYSEASAKKAANALNRVARDIEEITNKW